MKISKRLLPQRVVIRTYRGRSGVGEIYDDPVEVPARIAYENKLIRSRGGSEVVSGSQLLLAADAVELALLGSKVTLPHDNVERTIESGGPVMGMRKISHVRVQLI